MSVRRWIGASAALALAVAGCGAFGSDRGGDERQTLRVAYTVAGSGELLTLEVGDATPRSHGGGWWPDGGPRALSTPAWSPDGERLAYFEWASPRGKVLYVDDLSGERTAVTGPLTGRAAPDLSTAPPQAPLWSPDGRRIAFRRADANVRVVGVDGSGSWTIPTRRLAGDWYGIGLAWAPDGERLAVTIDWGRHEGTWIAEKGRLRRFAPSGATVRDPAWSPDGRWIAYSHDDGRGTDQIYVSSDDGVSTLRVTNDLPRARGAHFSNSAPVWSPDGSAIAFLSNREGRHSTELFVVGANGFGQRRLTRGVAVTAFPAGFGGGRTPAVRWSPDGRRLAFLGWSWFARPRIGVVHVDGRGLRRLAPAPLDDGYVAGFDLAWLGERESPNAPSQVPALAVPERRVSVVRDHLPDGPASLGRPRVVLRTPVDDSTTYDEHVDVSADGSRLSFLRRLDDHRFEVGVLDVRRGSRRVLTTGATTGSLERGGRFSPDGRRIVFRRWAVLLTVDVETGAVRRAADRAGEGPISWLADGRVTSSTRPAAYVSAGARRRCAQASGERSR